MIFFALPRIKMDRAVTFLLCLKRNGMCRNMRQFICSYIPHLLFDAQSDSLRQQRIAMNKCVKGKRQMLRNVRWVTQAVESWEDAIQNDEVRLKLCSVHRRTYQLQLKGRKWLYVYYLD